MIVDQFEHKVQSSAKTICYAQWGVRNLRDGVVDAFFDFGTLVAHIRSDILLRGYSKRLFDKLLGSIQDGCRR